MKSLPGIAFIVAVILAVAPAASAADSPDATIMAELKPVVTAIQEKINQGKHAEKDYTPELKQLDAIIEKHKAEKTDDMAQLLMMKAQLYLEVFDNTDEGKKIITRIKTDYPDTKLGMSADRMLNGIDQMEASKKIKRALASGAAFPDFDEKDLDGKTLSVASYKGKIVLVDFWATWCGPCVGEMPNVIKAYEKYHGKGFEIIGISLDQDKDALTGFIKAKNMAWPQYFDGQGWKNKLAQKYGIDSIPSNFLIGKDGKIIASDLRGEELDDQVGKALSGGK